MLIILTLIIHNIFQTIHEFVEAMLESIKVCSVELHEHLKVIESGIQDCAGILSNKKVEKCYTGISLELCHDFGKHFLHFLPISLKTANLTNLVVRAMTNNVTYNLTMKRT